jgi:hypothetical protein
VSAAVSVTLIAAPRQSAGTSSVVTGFVVSTLAAADVFAVSTLPTASTDA